MSVRKPLTDEELLILCDPARDESSYTLWPGSRAAFDAGCICPIMDNGYGDVEHARDLGGWWQVSDCPLHGQFPAPVPPRHRPHLMLDEGSE